MAKFHLITYGCQMNEYDSERVAGLLREQHWEPTSDQTEADLILVNTCAIREKAEDKVYSKLGELRLLKGQKPELVIGVMGCMAQLHQRAIQRRAPSVDLVFGSPAIARVAELVDQVRRERRPVLETGEGPLVKISTRPPAGGRLKEFVTVMEGCEKNCTFCVVPQTRGRERSHPPEVIVDEVRRLAAEGCREVTLLGQTVNAYGRDLTPRTDLGELFARVGEIEGIARIRFTTSNPYNLTPKLIRAMRDVPKVCEYFHLPLQSGSNEVLGRMNRGYTRERYLELVAEIRDAVPEMAFSTDLIVGFPGETDADFEQTLDMVETVGLRQRVRLPLLAAARNARRDDARPGRRRREGQPQLAAPGRGHAGGRRAERPVRGPDGGSPGGRNVEEKCRRAVGPYPLQSRRQLRRAGKRVRR